MARGLVPPAKIDVAAQFRPPDLPSDAEIAEAVRASPGDEAAALAGDDAGGDGVRPTATPRNTGGTSARASHFHKTGEVPHRILHSTEYRHFITNKAKGNPYREETPSWYIFNNIVQAQQGYRAAVPLPFLTQVLIANHVHTNAGGVFKFLTRLRDLVEILGHPAVGALEYDDVKCAVKINDACI